jgi:DNA-binding NarL/FixJ family response regulator
VDDSDVVRQHLTTLIEKVPGARVVGEAELGFDAVRGIRRLKPAVVVLDISMPGGSGLEVLETIRFDSHRPTIIVLTNFAHDRYRARCLELGADYFYDKLGEIDQVTAVIGRIAAQREPAAPRAVVAP